MKKLLCLMLALVMCAAVFSGCGKFDIDGEDLSVYVKLGDITNFSYDEIVKSFEAYREEQAEGTITFYATTGYTLDFQVLAETVDESGNTAALAKWTHNTESDSVKGYDVYRYGANSAFDYGLVYNVTDVAQSTTNQRLIRIDEAFSFTMTLDEDYEDTDLAGQTVKFTVTVKRALPAVYSDSYIAEYLQLFYAAAAASKDTIEYGDTVRMNFTGTIDGERFDGGTAEDYIIIVGEAGFVDGFEDQLVGHANKEKFDITVTFPEDYKPNPDLAGKEAVFAIQIKDVYNDNDLIAKNTPFSDMWELKYAFRVQCYAELALMNMVIDRSEEIELPAKLVSDFKKIYSAYVKRDVADWQDYYYYYTGVKYSKSEIKEMIYPDGDKAYIEESAKSAAFQYIVVKLAQQALDIKYTDKDYALNLQQYADEFTAYYGETYTPEDIEDMYGEEILRLSFISERVSTALYERITGMPDIPQYTGE